MMTILAVAVVGPWGYTDFLSDRTPTPTPAPALAKASATPSNPAVVEKPTRPAEPARPKTPNPTPPPAPAPAPNSNSARGAIPVPPAVASKPTLYRSTDAFGQAWEHPDPAYLTRFVEDRNRSLISPMLLPYPADRVSRCANGRCY